MELITASAKAIIGMLCTRGWISSKSSSQKWKATGCSKKSASELGLSVIHLVHDALYNIKCGGSHHTLHMYVLEAALSVAQSDGASPARPHQSFYSQSNRDYRSRCLGTHSYPVYKLPADTFDLPCVRA